MSLCDLSSANILSSRTRSGQIKAIAYRIEDVVVSRNEQGRIRITPQAWVKELDRIPIRSYGSRKQNMRIIHKICTGEMKVEQL